MLWFFNHQEIKHEISKSVGKTKHREMYGKLLVRVTIRSNIMFRTYLCACVVRGSKNISVERMCLVTSKDTTHKNYGVPKEWEWKP